MPIMTVKSVDPGEPGILRDKFQDGGREKGETEGVVFQGTSARPFAIYIDILIFSAK
jgi:hypothetical protein